MFNSHREQAVTHVVREHVEEWLSVSQSEARLVCGLAEGILRIRHRVCEMGKGLRSLVRPARRVRIDAQHASARICTSIRSKS